MASSFARRELQPRYNTGPMFPHTGSSPTPQATHYRLTSQNYGGFTFDSVGRASPPGTSSPDAPMAVLNGPPSAAYLPPGMGKTNGLNGRTVPYEPSASFGQKRTANQVCSRTQTQSSHATPLRDQRSSLS